MSKVGVDLLEAQMVFISDSQSQLQGHKVKCKRENGISAHLALINFLKGMIGPGCFSLPLAFKNGGLWMGFSLVFIIGAMCTVCMMKLVRCSQYFSKKHEILSTLDYGQLAEESFRNGFKGLRPYAPHFRFFVNSCLTLLQIGICSVFFIFVCTHTKEIHEHYYPNSNLSIYVYMVFAIFPFLVVSLVRNLVIISFISFAGNIFMITSVALILVELLSSPHHWRDLPAATNFNQIIIAAGAIIYSFEGQAMVLPLENRLKHGVEMRGWTGVLTTGMSLVTVVYAACGFYGYITYGTSVRGSITLNLPDNEVNLVVKVLLSLVILTGFPVQMYPVVEFLWPSLKKKMVRKSNARKVFAHYTLRAVLFGLSVIIAVSLPNLEDIIPLVGVSAGMLLALIIPAIIELNAFLPIYLEERARLKAVLCSAENGLHISVGLFFLCAGLYTNALNLTTGK